MTADEKLYGLMAEFADAEHLLAAARRLRDAGYERVEAYSPFAVEGLDEVLPKPSKGLGIAILLGGLVGGCSGYFMQWYASVVSYPLNVAGRPLHSWPAFLAVTFECTVLFAALTAFVGVLVTNALPQLHHPVFNVAAFERATRDRFFLCVEREDARFADGATLSLLEQLDAVAVHEVPR